MSATTLDAPVVIGVDKSRDFTPEEARIYPRTVKVGGDGDVRVQITEWDCRGSGTIHLAIEATPVKVPVGTVEPYLCDPIYVADLVKLAAYLTAAIEAAKAEGILPA